MTTIKLLANDQHLTVTEKPKVASGDVESVKLKVDFDALWGHRRNPVGYGEELERFDVKLGELLPLLKEDDLLARR